MIVKKNYQIHEKDTGSITLQIISIREKMAREWKHLKVNKKDIPAGRALEKKMAKEKRFFKYLKRRNPDVYEKLKKDIKIIL